MVRGPEVDKVQELLFVLNDFRMAPLISLNSLLIRANNLIEDHIHVMLKILKKGRVNVSLIVTDLYFTISKASRLMDDLEK